MLRTEASFEAALDDPRDVPVDATLERSAPYEPSCHTRIQRGHGVQLATDVYLPSIVGRKGAPTILIRTPYGRRGEIDAVPETAALFNAHGFAVVAQDVRGKFDSSGARTPFLCEQSDGYATLDWIATQPWSDSVVVPLGTSYAGFAAWAAAATSHPALRGVVARMTTCHVASEWIYRQGLFRLQMNADWVPFAWGQAELDSSEPDWTTRPLSGLGISNDAEEILRGWLRAPPAAPLWSEHGLAGPAVLSRQVTVPVLHWGGWWDLLARGQLREWATLNGTSSAGDQQLIMGATDHDFNGFTDTTNASAGLISRHNANTDAYIDFEPALAFLAAVVKGEAPGGFARWELTHRGWHQSPTWPPSRHPIRLYLADGAHAIYGPEGGVLAHRPDTLPMTVGWTHDPSDLVPSLETSLWGTLANDYPDERDAHTRDDVLTFSSQPAAEPLDIGGSLHVCLRAHASSAQTQLMAALCDVYPDGRALRIVEGGSLVSNASESPTVKIDLGPTAYRLRPDHRLRLAVAASSFPRYLWSPGDALDAWSDVAGPPAGHRLALGRESYLELSVLD